MLESFLHVYAGLRGCFT